MELGLGLGPTKAETTVFSCLHQLRSDFATDADG
ncbi:hypothetical protein BH09GEM1_BH09GEM1_03500 [soil metagenome]